MQKQTPQEHPPPSHMTIDNFMNKTMLENIDSIFADVNEYIFQKEQVDLNHVYIDGTKISAYAGLFVIRFFFRFMLLFFLQHQQAQASLGWLLGLGC